MTRKLAALFISLVVSACDPIHGIRTSLALTAPANVTCIDQTLRHTPGLGVVKHSSDRSESYQITPYRGKVITRSELWSYGPNGWASIQVLDDGKEQSFENSLLKMGQPYAEIDMARIIPVMRKANEALERECGLPIAERGETTRS